MHESAKIPSARIRDVLRAHTHEAHERLHQHASFAALFARELRIGDYRQLMLVLHGFYAALDREIERVMAGSPDTQAVYTYARRSDILARDLRDLNFTAEQINRNPQCERVAGIVSRASLGGVLYVIEGAMLGGATIDRAARMLLDDDGPEGRQYWAWCRAENKQRWGMTLRCLEYLCANEASLDDLAAGAKATFQMLSEWLAPLDKPLLVAEGGRA